MLEDPGEIRLRSNTFRVKEMPDLGLGHGVDGIGKWLEGLSLRVVQESALLKEE